VGTPIGIVVVVVAVVFCATFVVALARSAAHADDNSELLLADYLRELSQAISVARTETSSAISYAGIAGLAAAHETISREPSITLPSSSRSVGTMRLPVRRSTS
jgi:hypothetical protein